MPWNLLPYTQRRLFRTRVYFLWSNVVDALPVVRWQKLVGEVRLLSIRCGRRRTTGGKGWRYKERERERVFPAVIPNGCRRTQPDTCPTIFIPANRAWNVEFHDGIRDGICFGWKIKESPSWRERKGVLVLCANQYRHLSNWHDFQATILSRVPLFEISWKRIR